MYCFVIQPEPRAHSPHTHTHRHTSSLSSLYQLSKLLVVGSKSRNDSPARSNNSRTQSTFGTPDEANGEIQSMVPSPHHLLTTIMPTPRVSTT